jgi:ribosomal protein S18 acetylase RimI-like enzyme
MANRDDGGIGAMAAEARTGPLARVSNRPVNDHDRAFLERLYRSTRMEELSVLSWPEDQKTEFLRGQFEAQTRSWDELFPEAERTIILVDGQPAGRLYLDHRDDEIRIVDIALLPQYRGQGIGRSLLEAVLEQAESRGVVVRIHVEKNNPALRLYRRLRFRVVSDAGVYWLMESPPSEEDSECSSTL